LQTIPSAAEARLKLPAKSVAAELANNIPVARGIDRERALVWHFLVVVRQKNLQSRQNHLCEGFERMTWLIALLIMRF
jgi:hypothetical protein